MAAGDLLAGEGLAGDDTVNTSPEAALPPIVAIHFDGFTRDFPIGDDGRYESIHYVDSAMEMALHVAKGAISGDPTIGNGLQGLEHLDPDRLGARVRDEVRRCTARIVSAGDATIDGVSHSITGGGALTVFVDYFNERLPGRPRKSARV